MGWTAGHTLNLMWPVGMWVFATPKTIRFHHIVKLSRFKRVLTSKASNKPWNLLIDAAIRSDRPHDAVHVFDCLKSSRARPDAVTYSLLIKATSQDQWQQILDYLNQMQMSGVQDIVTYSASMTFLTKAEKWQAALGVFHQSLRRLHPDFGSFAAAFMACRRGSSWEQALSLVDDAESRRISLDDVSRNGIASALVSGDRVPVALEFAESIPNFNSILMSLSRSEVLKNPAWTWTLHALDKMGRNGINPNLGTFKAAASALKERPQMVLPIFRSLQARGGLQLDETALNMLVSALEKCHHWQEALLQLKRFTSQPDLAAYNSVISACAKVARWTLALSIAAEIGPNKWDEVTLGSLISACDRGEWGLALQLLEQGRLREIQPSRIAIHSAIVAFEGQHWPWAIHLLEESLAWRVFPDASMLGAVVSSCEKGHQWLRSLHLLNLFFAQKCTPDLAALTSSISACAKAHCWEATLQLLQEARMCCIALSCLCQCGRVRPRKLCGR